MRDDPSTLPLIAGLPPPRSDEALKAVPRRVVDELLRAAGAPAKSLGLAFLGAVIPALLFVGWSVAGERGWVSELILPPPTAVWTSFKELWGDGSIQGHIGVSSARVAKGFLLGASAGLLLGTVLGLSPRARALVQPSFTAASQVNIIAWTPLFILLIGIDEGLKILVVAWATLLPVTVNTVKGVVGIPHRWLELARVYQLRRAEVVWKVAVPAALPSLFTGLRSGLAEAWMSLVLVEMIASSEGVGYLVVWGRQLFQLDIVTVAILVIGALGLTLDLVLRATERRMRAWHFDAA